MEKLINTKAFARFINGERIEEGDIDKSAPSHYAVAIHEMGYTDAVNATLDDNGTWTHVVNVMYRKRQINHALKLLHITPAKYILAYNASSLFNRNVHAKETIA